MIEGLKVTIAGEELKLICHARVLHHRERAAVYREQIKSMNRDNIEAARFSNGDPIRALKDKQDDHESEAGEMEFIAKHIDTSENYLLDRSDLNKLGICRRTY